MSGPSCTSRIEAVADADRLAEFRQPLNEFIVNAALDEQPRAGDADLAGVGVDAHRRARHRHVEIGVGEDDVRRLAAEFELTRASMLPAEAWTILRPVSSRAGEGERSTSGMLGQRGAGFCAVAGDDVDDAVGMPASSKQLRDAQRRQRRVFGRLEHGRAAGRQRRPEDPPLADQRRIPGNDAADHAHRRLELQSDDSRLATSCAASRTTAGAGLRREEQDHLRVKLFNALVRVSGAPMSSVSISASSSKCFSNRSCTRSSSRWRS